MRNSKKPLRRVVVTIELETTAHPMGVDDPMWWERRLQGYPDLDDYLVHKVKAKDPGRAKYLKEVGE